jgi:hypothetical protein
MSNTKNTKGLLLGPSAQGLLVGNNTLCSILRNLTEISCSYRKARDITNPVTAQFSALILEQASLLPITEVEEIHTLLWDWKLKEATTKPFDSYYHLDGRSLTPSAEILQQLADNLITAVCDEHSLAMRANIKRDKVHGSRDAFEFQCVEQAKGDAIKKIHKLTSKVADILEQDAIAVAGQKDAVEESDEFQERPWSVFFKDFNEKEFELALCAVLLLDKLETEKEYIADKNGAIHRSVVKMKDTFKIKDFNA